MRSGRPRLPVPDGRVGARRAQYRNAKRRKRGQLEKVEEILPRKIAVWMGTRWVPAVIDRDGRRIFDA